MSREEGVERPGSMRNRADIGRGERVYLDLIKTGFDWALPPPATMMTNDIPAFASGTVASIAESLMNLKSTDVLDAALKVTV